MLQKVKSLLGKLLRERSASQRAVPTLPDFKEERLFEQLKAPQEAVAAWRAGRREAAWEQLLDHFSHRAMPLGFIGPERVPVLLAEAARRFPPWRGRLLAKVEAERNRGLQVYDRLAGPLDGAFDWQRGAGNPLSDRLYQARPHRFGFLPRWALACHFDHAFIPELDAVLAGWMTAAQLPGGHPGFKSSHVVIYHLLALLLAWPILAALEAEEQGDALASLRRRVLLALFEGSRAMAAASGGSVANNHLLAERFADWLIASLLPEFGHVMDRAAAETVWLAELERQVNGDGGSFEHSVHYQEHACELAVTYLLISRRNGWTIPAQSLGRIERMLAFQLGLAGPSLVPLLVGNTTEDPLLVMGVGEGWQLGLLREVQRACFHSDAPAAPDSDVTREAAFWLLDGAMLEATAAPAKEDPFQAFADSGFYVLAEPEREARLILRLGPTATAPGIGGHSHGDLLSLSLTVGDSAVLAQPGTCSYRFRPHPELPGGPNLRAHFASASSRSTLFLEGAEPYGPLTGDFRNWQLPCHVEPRQASAAAAGLSWVEGRIAGESAYAGHRRGVVHIWGEGWLVYDRLPRDRGRSPAFVGWQFGSGVNCVTEPDGFARARAPGGVETMLLPAAGGEKPDVLSGSFEPLRGWVSPSYGRLDPAPNLRFPLGADNAEACFLLSQRPLKGWRLEPTLAEDEALGFRISGPDEEMLVLICSGEGSARIALNGVVFQGRLLCLSREPEGVRVRTLGLEHLSAPDWGLDLKAEEPCEFEAVFSEASVQWPRGQCPAVNLGADPDGR